MQSIQKNKKGAIVTNTIMAVGGLVIGVIIIYVVVSTLISADLFSGVRDSTTLLEVNVDLNTTNAFTLGNAGLSDSSCSVTIVNATGEAIGAGTYTLDATACTVISIAQNESAVNITSVTTYDGTEEQSVTDLQANFTDGVGNVSSKIPTILLIIAVVFLFGALVLLMRNARAMGVGGGGSL